ncbi:hypothetical protein H6F44_10080 [Pseudanabaena sp. FACHB-1277]|uniref:Bacterial repeat domain-containing protein n=1 Tax=Pseudanabaena cinerea FACHB-1277 TaxID=2949581 RepID=A0A926USW0_9CYAN|nr:hypothetical protein [Pseudanabaena cinerea]MBD2150464.1 hypothetical protein [Pseudanabaena cinerea FACHB-1277]
MAGITPKYELKIIIDPPMAGKVDGAGKYAEGKDVQVEVTAFGGWKFIGWVGDWSHSKKSFSFVIEKDMTATATFEKIFKPSTALVTISLISFFFLSAIVVYIYSTEKSNLIQNINSLERDKNELKKQNQILNEENKKLNEAKNILEDGKKVIEGENKKLNETKNTLEDDKKVLEGEKKKLNEEIRVSNEKIKTLEKSIKDKPCEGRSTEFLR